jgi:N4-gp56 family major capsid protein
MKKLFSIVAVQALHAFSKSGDDFDGHRYNSGTDATSGANTVTHYYDRMGIKAAIDENLFTQAADRRSMPKKYGKTYKTSKWLHILDDDNMNDQGNLVWDEGSGSYVPAPERGGWKVLNKCFMDHNYDGADTAAKHAAAQADAQRYADQHGGAPLIEITAGYTGNQYGGSRDIGYVAENMPVLQEGASDVNRVGVTKITVETSLKRFGNYLEYTDEVELFSEDNVQLHYREELGYMAGQVYDDLIQIDMINGAGVVAYTGTATSEDTVTDIMAGVQGYNLIRKVEKQLFINKAKKTTSIIAASTKIGTTPVNAGWTAFIDSDTKYDLEALVDVTGAPAWIPVHKYASSGNIRKGEVGAIHDTRFIEAPRMMFHKKDEENNNLQADVHYILYVTPDSFATVGLQGNNKIMFKSKAPGQADATDKFGLRGFFSYNMFYSSIVLQPERMAIIKTAAS